MRSSATLGVSSTDRIVRDTSLWTSLELSTLTTCAHAELLSARTPRCGNFNVMNDVPPVATAQHVNEARAVGYLHQAELLAHLGWIVDQEEKDRLIPSAIKS